MFIGKIGCKPGAPEEVIGNFLSGNAHLADLGTWKDRDGAFTFASHEADKEITQIAAEFGYAILSIRDFACEIVAAGKPEMPEFLQPPLRKGRTTEERIAWQAAWLRHHHDCQRGFVHKPNSIYFPKANLSAVETELHCLKEYPNSYLQVVLDEKICNARYFAEFLNSPTGVKLRHALSGLTEVDPKALAQTLTYMPPLAVQEDLLALNADVLSVIGDMMAMRKRMWGCPSVASSMRKRIGM